MYGEDDDADYYMPPYFAGQDEEAQPLTPRDPEDAEASSQSTTPSSVSSLSTSRSRSTYLSFFKSPNATIPMTLPPRSANSLHRTPLYTLPERRNATSAQINSRESLEGSEESSQTSSAKGGYLSDPFSRYPILKYPKDTTPRNEVILQQTENDAENTPQMEVVRSSGYHHHRQSTGDESGSVFQGIFSSPVSEDGLSVISTAMHLQGQNMGSAMFDDEYYPRRSSSGTNTQCSDDVSRRCHVFWNRHAGNPLAQLWSAHIRPALYSRTPRSLRQRRGKVLSPRSRNLQDLEYLTNQHKHKVGQLFHHQNEAHTEEEFFDFCLILQPQEVYGYWSTLLDFRQEVLGPLAEDDDESSNILRSIVNRVYSTDETDPSSCEDADVESAAEDPMRHKEYGFDPSIVQTPAARNSVLRRRATPQPSLIGTGASVDEDHGTVSFHHTPGQSVNGASVSRFHRHRSLPPSPGGLYSVVSRMSNASTMRRSLFERAIGSPCEDSKTFDPAANNNSIEMRISDAGMQRQALSVSFCNRTNELGTLTPAPNQTVIRRRWGNQAAGHRTPSMISPPIRSLTRGVSMTERKARPRVPARKFSADDEIGGDGQDDVERQENSNPNVIRIEDIPPQRFARGIASRTNGLLPFLSALKRGVVLRKHRPGQEAIFCKLYSEDGGDTIRFIVLDSNDAIHAFKEQRVRYNKIKYEGQADDIAPAQQWSLGRSDEDDDLDQNNKFSVPDYVAAKQYRDKMNRDKTLGRRINALAAKTVRGGSIKASDIVVVHPGSFSDPRSTNGELATASFRRSKSEYNNQLSFSLITRTDSLLSRANNSQMTIDECENRWLTGEGSESQFKYHDFEAATEGEYWLAFRGFLLLHRDAAVGRYAEQRAAGIGSHYSRLELEQREKADMDLQNQLHVDEFHEPVTAGFLERALAKLRGMDTSYMEGYTLPSAVPPPSDYFLGFRSPGTAIWSRLRQAGLETCRVYSLDPNRVMIKVRCPPERLMDVAEVLRLKLKTSDGSFAPFREDMMDFFEGLKDPLESPSNFDSSYCPFRSSLRQTIIDFIVGSRIRDSGAELSQNTDLGKMILARVPLHMHGKLNALYQSWFYFWRPSNWDGRDGRSLEHAPMDNVATEGNASLERSISSPVGSESLKSNQIPGRFKRFMIGSFYQPLDSIEQYFGEKVAFYFVWLQHTASHLVVLTAAGLLVFVIQICSGNWDHPIRPYFAMFVMLWTFVVLINWKKRANLMAYRWGTMNYKQQETTRPQFRGDYTLDDVTGEWVVTYPKWKRWAKYCISFPLTLLFTFGSLVLIFWVHANRDHQLANYLQYKYNPGSETYKIGLSLDVFGDNVPVVQLKLTSEILKDPTFWFIVAGLPSLLGLFLPLLNLILMKISVLLNDFENYRTESEYRTFLIIKVFSFRFVCYFATLYYYAFMSIGSDEALENGTLRVATGVLIYTTVAQWWQNFLHVCFPIGIRLLRMRHRRNRLCDELRDCEVIEEEITRQVQNDEIDDELKSRHIRLVNKRLLLDQAQDKIWLEVMLPQHDSFPEYIQAVVQFTYVSCFSVALPITPLIVLFNYLLCMRLDAYKLCKGRRRPLAEKTGGIGIWEHLLHIVAVISVLTNCWLVGFTTSTFLAIGENIGQIGLFAVVVGWEHVMLLIKYVMQTSISPLPRCVRDAMKKEQYEVDQQRSQSILNRRLQHQREEEWNPTGVKVSGGSSYPTSMTPGTYPLRTIPSTDEG